MTLILNTKNLTKDYGSGRGCKNITLSIDESRIFGFLGPNGAGKSTFVKMMVGLLEPTSGEAQLLGHPLGSLAARRQIGYLPELFRYQDWLTGEEVLRFHAKLERKREPVSDKRILEVLHDVGLHERSFDRVKNYSKGMQQRLGLACALLLDPKLVFLDEPTSALDPIGRQEVRRILVRLRDEGKTVFLNTHLLDDVEALCDEVALLDRGEIRAINSVNGIIRQSSLWEFTVGGWTHDAARTMEVISGLKITVQNLDANGRARLHLHMNNEEQVGWMNYQIIHNGLTLYSVRRVENRIEDWFLSLTAQKRGEGL